MSKTNIVEKIKGKIEKGEIKMKPKWYFVFGSLFISLGMLVSFLFSAFFINLMSHRLRVQRTFEYLPMGGPGRMMFLRNFPWHFLLVALGLILIGAWLLRKYDISYKKSFIIVLSGIFLSVIFAGLVADKIGINNHLQNRPGLNRLYRMPKRVPPSDLPSVRGKTSPERKMPPRMYYKQ